MNKQKLTDALTALETSTQLHKDAIGYSQKAIEANQLAVKLLIEASEKNEEKTTVQVNGKYTLLDDNGLHVFSTPDSYRKHIVELAKEEIANADNKTIYVPFQHKEEDIIKVSHDGIEKITHATLDEEYHVNKERRTVVCLLRGHKTRYVYAKGIAKCDPKDTFNEHIGKVIALFRAIGEEVPELFTNVPNPEKIHNGDIIRHKNDSHGWKIDNIATVDDKIRANYHYDTINYTDHLISKRGFDEFKIIDDSNRK